MTAFLVTLAIQAVPSLSLFAPDKDLDAAFEKLSRLAVGESLDAFDPIRQAVVQSRENEGTRAALERRLITVLEGDATDLAKDYACRQLAIVGSDAAFAALQDLLPDPRLSYMARFALEGIGGPEAEATLRESLDLTEGPQKQGVVISLGRLRGPSAVPQLAGLLNTEDAQLQEVTVIALGRIGTRSAADALGTFAAQAPESLRFVVADAQLHAAEGLCERGEFEPAAEVCQSLLAHDSPRIRGAAFRGLINARPSQSLKLIREALAGDDSVRRAVAADCVVGLALAADIETIAAAVPDLPRAGKTAALVSLGRHAHPAVRKASLAVLEQGDVTLDAVALRSLLKSADTQDVPLLADLASTSTDAGVRVAAFDVLRLMTAEGTNAALIELLEDAARVDPTLVRCALARRRPDFVPAFLKAAGSGDEATRLEAFKALEIMASDREAEALVRLLAKTSPGKEREAADRAVWMSCRQIPDLAERARPLLAAMETADTTGQCALLPSLARLGGESALDAVHKAMRSKSRAVRDAGYRALANWPDASVADELIDIAKTSPVESYRIWSLRAYARVVSLPDARPPREAFRMLQQALTLATRDDDRRLIISRLGSVRVPQGLELLLSLVDHDTLRAATIPAVYELAKGLSETHPEEAKAALVKIEMLTDDDAMLQQIPKVLRDIDARLQKQKK